MPVVSRRHPSVNLNVIEIIIANKYAYAWLFVIA